ncbi:MAG: hypothetical protein WC498_04050 [Candidatus Saccharimonadales bacterium]
METLAAQPSHEKLKSFDPLASVDMFRFDIERFGRVLPETRYRVHDEELSHLTEAVDRAACTEFILRKRDDQIEYFDKGNWRPYIGSLLTALEVAKQEATEDPRRAFLAERAVTDLWHGYKLQSLKPGEQHVWYSPYPKEEAARFGEAFVRELGFSPEREMGFLYRAYCDDQGDVVLESQTVDHSDDEAFSAAMNLAESDHGTDTDALVNAYDETLAQKYGGNFYAGRRDAEIRENAWNTIRDQRDLVEYLLAKLETIAKLSLPRHELERAAKKHVYGVWALFKKRLDGEVQTYTPLWHEAMPLAHFALLDQQVMTAFNEFAARGAVMPGCGGAIHMQGEESILGAEGSEVFKSIFGKDEDRYGSLEFKCPKGHNNRRPHGKLIETCQKCGVSVRC